MSRLLAYRPVGVEPDPPPVNARMEGRRNEPEAPKLVETELEQALIYHLKAFLLELGNGRVSRLLLLLSQYQLGFEAGRYISLERLIEQSKKRYYETLKQSSQRWHEGKHDRWPYVNYLLYTLKELYAEFERRVGEVRAARGEKTEIVQQAISGFRTPFHITELQRRCPGVSLDMIRKILKDITVSEEVRCMGRGKKAMWRVLGNG